MTGRAADLSDDSRYSRSGPQVYVYTTCDGSVRAYDEACISRSNETLYFETFGEFVEWLTDEAQSMKPHMTCCRILNRLVTGKYRAIL